MQSNDSGQQEGAAAAMREVARLREQLASAERRSRRVAAELQRHWNDALAIMLSVVRRTHRSKTSLADYAMHLESRLAAIARGQGLAARAILAGSVELDTLLAEELLAHSAQEDGQVTLTGPPVRVPASSAATLGLAFHEMALNAVVHGALSTPAGRIAVRWRYDPDTGDAPQDLHLEWRESGGPAPAVKPQRGFGMDMVERTLAYELRAKSRLHLEAAGARWELILPLETQAP